MKLSWIIIFSVSAVFTSAQKHNESCNCKSLMDCDVLLSKFLEATKKSDKDKWQYAEYLRSLHCGFTNITPKVCCPSESNAPVALSNFTTTTTELPSTTESTVIASMGTGGEEKNIYSECGRSIRRDYHLSNRTDLSDFPWLALLEFDTNFGKKFLCGGVLVSDQYVLTAAHCASNFVNKLVSVQLGEHDTSTDTDCISDGNEENTMTCTSSAVKVAVEKIIVHEGYNDGITPRDDDTPVNDLALVKLAKKVDFSSYIQPICLPRRQIMKQKYLIGGWGRSSISRFQGQSQKLVSVLSMMELERCMADVRLPFVSKEHICAGSKTPQERACIADAGGPLMGYEKHDNGQYRLTVFGVSFMDMSCDRHDLPQNLPGVYTRVIDHMPWILKHINKS